jgi:dipeptidyl aminopeptidase/acylaminoacyl peptidase
VKAVISVCAARIGVMFSFLILFGQTIQASDPDRQRPVTVADAIAMTGLSDQYYFLGGSSEGRVAHFSPDGKWFSIVLEKGDIAHNTVAYTLLLFETSRAFDSPKPKVLATLNSSSDRPAIKDPKWLDDNQTLVFLCEEEGETSQVCFLDRTSGKIRKVTHHQTPVLSFAVSGKGNSIVFLAEPPAHTEPATQDGRGIVITAETPDAIPQDDCVCPRTDLNEADQLYMQKEGGAEQRIQFRDFMFSYQSILMSPDGRYAVLPAAVTDIPEAWKGYKDPLVQKYVNEKRSPGRYSFLGRYLLLDMDSGEIRPLINAPLTGTTQGIAWAEDSSSVVVSGTFLPLSGDNSGEQTLRKTTSFVVEVDVPGGGLTKISDRELKITKWLHATNEIVLQPRFASAGANVRFQKRGRSWREFALGAKDGETDAPLVVSLKEDLNRPPDIYVSDRKTPRTTLLLQLNPQFKDLALGHAESVIWKATDGHEVNGTLFLPPQFRAGVKYPLVIQTHGTENHRFEMDGPWHSAFAARMLVGRNIVVLEVDHATVLEDDARAFNTPEEAPREMAAYEGAIDYLDGRGIIDRTRVGILGFSRTVWKVEFTLTHSKYSFAAATLADGFDAGYWQYLVYRGADTDFVRVNGGQPFGEGLEIWLRRSPSFLLGKVQTPVRFEAHGSYSVLGSWEWFSGLTHLGRPVEMIYLPGAPHLLVKPWDRLASQQGTVDWFCFWLKGEEDRDPAKSEQYRRWRAMRQLEHAQN